MEIRENFEDDKILPPLMKVMLDCLSHLICQYTKMRQTFNGVITYTAQLLVGQVLRKTPLATLEAFEAFRKTNKQLMVFILTFEGTKFCFMIQVMFDCLSQSICQHTKTRQIFNGVTRSAAQLLVVQVLGKTPLSTPRSLQLDQRWENSLRASNPLPLPRGLLAPPTFHFRGN